MSAKYFHKFAYDWWYTIKDLKNLSWFFSGRDGVLYKWNFCRNTSSWEIAKIVFQKWCDIQYMRATYYTDSREYVIYIICVLCVTPGSSSCATDSSNVSSGIAWRRRHLDGCTGKYVSPVSLHNEIKVSAECFNNWSFRMAMELIYHLHLIS